MISKAITLSTTITYQFNLQGNSISQIKEINKIYSKIKILTHSDIRQIVKVNKKC